MLESHDIAARRHRDAVADADHFGEHAEASNVQWKSLLMSRLSVRLLASNELRSSNRSPARRLRLITTFSSGLRPRSAAEIYAATKVYVIFVDSRLRSGGR